MSRDATREEARLYVTASAEQGRWELACTRIFRDGRREYREVRMSRDATREEARLYVTASAEQGRWELACTRIFRDGRREYRLRRRVIHVSKTA